MAYADLSAAQQEQLDSWNNNVRAAMGDFQRLINSMESLRDAYWVANGINDLFGVGNWAGANAVVPNNSGLAGAAAQDKDDLVALLTQMEGVLINAAAYTTGFDTDALRQQRVAAAGPLISG